MNTLSQPELVGNTNATSPIVKIPNNQCYRWAFTLKAEPREPDDPKVGVDIIGGYKGANAEDIWNNLMPHCKELYFQLEESDTGYLHYQGCFSLNIKHRLDETKNILGYNEVHLERVKNWSASKRYCQKHETRVLGPWTHLTKWVKTIKVLRPWQQKIFDMISIPCEDERSIFWYWEPVGNIGKTAFCKYCAVHLKAGVVRGGALKDIAFSLGDEPSIVIFDITRTVENRVNYEALEQCKDGMMFSAKYESRMKVFNSPHVIVFANFAPEYDKLSMDRWKVCKLTVDEPQTNVAGNMNSNSVNSPSDVEPTNESSSTRESEIRTVEYVQSLVNLRAANDQILRFC